MSFCSQLHRKIKGVSNNMIIETIKQEIETLKYKPHGNEWSIANQLIDIIAIDPSAAELVAHDIKKEGMTLKNLVKSISGKRVSNPFEVMKEICEFYGLNEPAILPPEQWRNPNLQSTAKPKLASLVSIDVDFEDLF